MFGLKKISVLMLSTFAIAGCHTMPSSSSVPYQVYAYQDQQVCPTELTLNVGDEIKFTVSDNPSTGYSWKLKQALQHLDATSVYNAHKTEGYLVVGMGGKREFRFKALTSGQDTIHLVYNRSWSPQEVGAEWTCQVTIR